MKIEMADLASLEDFYEAGQGGACSDDNIEIWKTLKLNFRARTNA